MIVPRLLSSSRLLALLWPFMAGIYHVTSNTAQLHRHSWSLRAPSTFNIWLIFSPTTLFWLGAPQKNWGAIKVMIIFMTTVDKKLTIIVHLAFKKTAYYSLQSCEQNQKYSVIQIPGNKFWILMMRFYQKRTVSFASLQCIYLILLPHDLIK